MTFLNLVLACVATLAICVVAAPIRPVSNRVERRLLIFAAAAWAISAVLSLIDGDVPYWALFWGLLIACLLDDRQYKAYKARQRVQ